MTTYIQPKIKETDQKLYEGINRQFLSYFPDKEKGLPRGASDTCDTHIYMKQPFLYVDPKGNGMEEVTWSEPRDAKVFWENKIRFVWLGIAIICFFFFLLVYYYWGRW